MFIIAFITPLYLILNLKISKIEAKKVNAPIDVASIAKIIRPPIWAKGTIVDNNRAPNPILDQASNIIGYPTLSIVFFDISSNPYLFLLVDILIYNGL